MTNLEQEFYDTLLTYDFFARSGRMDVEEHCLWAHIAVNLDGVRPPPAVNAFFDLLTSMAHEASTLHESPTLQHSQFKPGVSYDENVHPGGNITLLHVATAVHFFDRYIFRVGELLGRRPTGALPQSGFWIDPDWVYTGAFFDAFQRSITTAMVLGDEKGRQERGYSLFEAMHLKPNDGGDDIVPLLASHSEDTDAQLALMTTAIHNHAYEEAIGIELRLIESILASTLHTHGLPNRGRLVELIAIARNLDEQRSWGSADSFWLRLGDWRKTRNRVTHSNKKSLLVAPPDPEKQKVLTEQVALAGAELVPEVRSWGINARAKALDMSLPRPAGKRAKH